MFCPRCKSVNLKHGRVKSKNTIIDYCPVCKGIWFDAGELEEVSALAAKDLQIQDGAQKNARICPRCRKLLYAFEYPQTFVLVDMCSNCKGLWLDAGELKEIEAVRLHYQQQNRLDQYAKIPGIKGKLIRLVDAAINNLKEFPLSD